MFQRVSTPRKETLRKEPLTELHRKWRKHKLLSLLPIPWWIHALIGEEEYKGKREKEEKGENGE